MDTVTENSGESLRVLVCGSRTFRDGTMVNAVLDGLWTEHTVGYLVADMNGMTLIEGGARGADSLAAWWAQQSPMHAHNERPDNPPFEHLTFPAKWDEHGKGAGYIRNKQMLDEGKPNMVVAFVDKPLAESKGTAMMVNLANAAGVPVFVVQYIAPGNIDGDVT
jgi:hypothetical protein